MEKFNRVYYVSVAHSDVAYVSICLGNLLYFLNVPTFFELLIYVFETTRRAFLTLRYKQPIYNEKDNIA